MNLTETFLETANHYWGEDHTEVSQVTTEATGEKLQEFCELYFHIRTNDEAEMYEDKPSGIVTVVIIASTVASIVATLVFCALTHFSK